MELLFILIRICLLPFVLIGIITIFFLDVAIGLPLHIFYLVLIVLVRILFYPIAILSAALSGENDFLQRYSKETILFIVNIFDRIKSMPSFIMDGYSSAVQWIHNPKQITNENFNISYMAIIGIWVVFISYMLM